MSDLQFITDSMGNKTGVLIPYQQWLLFEAEYRRVMSKKEILESLRDGIREVKTARREGKKLKTLKAFLSEGLI